MDVEFSETEVDGGTFWWFPTLTQTHASLFARNLPLPYCYDVSGLFSVEETLLNNLTSSALTAYTVLPFLKYQH